MNHISTKEAAARWGISQRRIAMLAACGRIPGAVLIGKSWFIPADAAKPEDGRRSSSAKPAEAYVFPVPMAYRRLGETPVGQQSQDAECLCLANALYESGDFEASLALSEDVLRTSENSYIRIGALFLLVYTALMLHRFDDVSRYSFLLFGSISEAPEHREELAFLYHEIESVIDSSDWFLNCFSIDSSYPYSRSGTNYISVLLMYRDVLLAILGRKDVDPLPHELTCLRLEQDGYIYLATMMHIYLSVLYASKGDYRAEERHAKQAVDYSVENNIYTTSAMLFAPMPDTALRLMSGYPEEVRNKFISLGKRSMTCIADYLASSGKTSLLTKLSTADLRFISYCVKGYSVEAMADMESLSVSATKHRLVPLYKKVGVSSKKQLSETYSRLLSDFRL